MPLFVRFVLLVLVCVCSVVLVGEVSPYSAAEFIARGGRIPAPIRSLTN